MDSYYRGKMKFRNLFDDTYNIDRKFYNNISIANQTFK